MTLSVRDKNRLCQQYLNRLYFLHHDSSSLHKTNIIETYGEILYPSINQLLSFLSLSEQDVFLDLGSGIGKIVMQVFLNSTVKEAMGIEIQQSQYEKAKQVAEQCQHELPEFFLENRKLTFLQGDFLTYAWNHVTAVFINSICFNQTILQKVGQIINVTPSIHTVMSLRPMDSLEHLRLQKVVKVQCSWDSALCYIYQ